MCQSRRYVLMKALLQWKTKLCINNICPTRHASRGIKIKRGKEIMKPEQIILYISIWEEWTSSTKRCTMLLQHMLQSITGKKLCRTLLLRHCKSIKLFTVLTLIILSPDMILRWTLQMVYVIMEMRYQTFLIHQHQHLYLQQPPQMMF